MDLQVLDILFAHLIDNDCTDDLSIVYNLVFKICRQFQTTLNGCWHRFLLRRSTDKIWSDLCGIHQSQIVLNAWLRYSGSNHGSWIRNADSDNPWSETLGSFADITVFKVWTTNAMPPEYYWHFYSQRLFRTGRFNFLVQISANILNQLDDNEKLPTIAKRMAPESNFIHLCFRFQHLLQKSRMHLFQLNSIEMRFLCQIAQETNFKEIHFDIGGAMLSANRKRTFEDMSTEKERLSITLPQGCQLYGENLSLTCSTTLLKRATQGVDTDLLHCKDRCLVQIGFYNNPNDFSDNIAIALFDQDSGKCFSFVKTS